MVENVVVERFGYFVKFKLYIRNRSISDYKLDLMLIFKWMLIVFGLCVKVDYVSFFELYMWWECNLFEV